MRYTLLLVLLCCFFDGFADYDPSKTSYPYEYYYDSNDDEWYSIANGVAWDWGSTHNSNSGSTDQYFEVAIFDDGYASSCYKFYAEVVLETIKRRPNGAINLNGSNFSQHSVGTLDLNQLQPTVNNPGGNNTLPKQSYITFVKAISGGNSHVLILNFNDFPFADADELAAYSLRVIVIKEGGGSCGDEQVGEVFYSGNGGWQYAQLDTIDFRTQAPDIKISLPDLTVCNNDATSSVTASVTGITNPYTVTWAANAGSTMPAGVTYSSSGTGKTNDVFNINPALATAGTYKVRATVTDDTDNTVTADTVFDVVVHPALQVAIATDESGNGGICESQSVHLSATPTGSNYTYKWTHTPTFGTDINMTTASADSSSVTGTLTGVAGGSSRKYIVEVTNTVTGCSATADTTIVVKKKPNIKLEINASAANTVAVCSGEAVVLKASNTVAADESRTTYQWIIPTSGGSTNPLTVYPTVATAYEVRGTVDGCSMTVQKNITINPKPEINITHDPSSVCASTLGGDGTINLTTLGISSSVTLTSRSYFQTLGGTPITNPNAVTLAVGSHNFWLVGETASGCKDTVTFTAKVNDLPGKPVITGTQEVCDGKNVNLSIQSPVANSTYAWKNGVGTSLGTGTALTTYVPSSSENLSVTVTDGNGCQNTSDAYAITVNGLPSITFSASPAVACADETIRISANITGGTPSYSGHVWTGVTNIASDNMSADLTLGRGNTSYSLKVTDAKGCEATGGTGSAFGHYLDVTLSAGGTVNIGSPVTLTTTTIKDGTAALPNSTVRWTFKDDNTGAVLCGPSTASNSCNPVVTALTRYKVEVEDVNTGCTAWDTITPHITPGAPLNVTSAAQPLLCYGETDFSGKYFLVRATNGLPAYSYVWDDIPGWMSYEDKGDTLKITGIDWDQAVTTSVKCEVTDRAGDRKEISLTLTIRPFTHLAVNTQGNNGELKICQHTGTNDQYALNVTRTTGANLTSVKWLAPTSVSVNANPLNISTATPNSVGTDYTVTGVDVNNCPTDTVTVKVIVNELPPVITLTATGDSVCPGAPVTVRVASAGSESTSQYTWKVNGSDVGSGLQKSPNISVATKFEVQRTDVNGCITTADTTIQVYVPEVLNLSEDQTVCSVPTPNLTLTANGLTGSGVYTWSSVPNDPNLGTNGTSHTVSPTQNTTYYVDGMDGHGCTVKRDSIVIKVDQMPTFNLSAHKLAACNSVKLYDAVGTVSPDGATLKYGTTANFTGGTTFTSTSTVSESRLYYVRAENGVCKSDEDTVRVNILTAPQLKLLASTIETCEPDSVDLAANVDWTPGTGTTFDAMNLTYWDGAPATGTQLASTKVYPGVTSKTYSVQGASDGCPSKVETVTVIVHPKPVLEISVSDTAVCTATADLNVAVNAHGGLSVTKTYFTDATYATPLTSSLVSSGTYYVIGETVAGCKDSIEVTVRVKPHPVVTLIASADMVCKDATVDLTVNGGAPTDTYSWKVNGTSVTESSNHFTSPAIATNTPIEVTVTNTEGCETVLDTTIGVYISTVTLAASSNCLGETVTITATLTGDGTPTGYTWTGATPIGATNQATLTLTASDQTVGVEVTTDKGCTIEGQQEFRGRPCGVLVVEAPDTTICLSGDDVILTAHSFGGTVTDWTWTQVSGSTVALTFADSVLTLPSTTPLGTYQFEVSVNGGAAKDTAEVTIQQGVTITSLSALDSCSSVVNFQVVAVNATSYDWELLSANGMGYNVPGNINRWELILDGGETNYSVAVTASNDSGCEAHDTLSGHILNTGLMLAFGGNDTCGTNIQLPVRYSVNGGYGDVVMKYTYQSQNGTQTEDSIRVNPPSSVSLTAANPGIYVLTKVYATNAPGCLVTVNDTVKIGALPEVELDENCLALHKDSTFNLNIVNSGDFDYIWGVQESSDGVVWTGSTGDDATTTSVNGMMGDKDLQYIITATDRNLPQCKVSDTARIYRIPDAPVVDIDTINDKRHIQLIWGNTNWADNYTVWSRKWDPYCLTGKDGNVYAAESSGTGIIALSWAEPAMDSLEFYYVTANRTICNVEYKSFETDTFGYVRHIADATDTEYTTKRQAGIYAFPYIFDMHTRYGLTYITDFVDYILDGKHKDASNKLYISSVNAWAKDEYKNASSVSVKEPGNWGWLNDSYMTFTNQWVGMTGVAPAGTHVKLKVGLCFSISVNPGNRIEFVMFGKLRDSRNVVFDNKNVADTGGAIKSSPNIFYLPFERITSTTSKLIGTGILTKLSAIGYWNMDKRYPAQNPQSDSYITFTGKFTSETSSAMLNGYHARAGYDVLFLYVGGSEGKNSLINFTWP